MTVSLPPPPPPLLPPSHSLEFGLLYQPLPLTLRSVPGEEKVVEEEEVEEEKVEE